MNYKCKNCGGSMVFSPSQQKMLCPYCSQTDCETITGDASMVRCPSCGGELNPGIYESSSRCPFCDNYIIFDERVTGAFLPNYVIPFKLDKKDAVSAIEKEFKKRIFAPMSFLSEKTLKLMSGSYVPFFLYDYSVDARYEGTGTKVRSWREGNYTCTETSFYKVIRQMKADYDNIPVDASYAMPDADMDLMEPYDYEQLLQFDPKYLSGFFGEVYNDNELVFEPRAVEKAKNSTKAMLQDSAKGYATLTPSISEMDSTLMKNGVQYALFPVWIYRYKWGNKEYPVYVNGQTGKAVGKTPISVGKVIAYGLFLGLILAAILWMIIKIWEVF